MENRTLPFPGLPIGADKSIIKPSPAFKKEVYRSAGAILLFVFTYLFLFFGALAIAIAFMALGYTILMAGLNSFGLLIGIAFAAAGAMLIFFVIKFLFKRSRMDYSGMLEITEDDQPRLFAFIRQVTAETDAPKPKRIFITANVNAGVFYNSSFWSMFFPVRKNLQIGLGLVNSVNVSEFKAIMAHEFGHFAQRSMKFGSYVYNLNKVIHNMLFENDAYERVLNRWARMHAIFRLMAFVNINLVKGMQFILKKVYVVVNKTYMGLSREMEYHADTIAAYVSGSNQAINSLKRIEIGQMCYDSLLNYWGVKFAGDKRSGNLYPQHTEVIKLYAEKHHLDVDPSGLPVIDPNLFNLTNNQITFDDPWLSHPLTEDRELNLKRINLKTETVQEPAWQLFDDPKKLQETLTGMVYAQPLKKGTHIITDVEEFKNDFLVAVNHHLHNPVYCDYFDNRELTEFDVDEMIASAENANPTTFEDLFSDKNCRLPATAIKLQQNINLLAQVIEDRKDVKNFYFHATKISRENAAEIKTNLEAELQDARNRVKELDKNAFFYFYNIDKKIETRQLLADKYRLLFKYQRDALKDHELYNDLLETMRPVYSKMKVAQIRDTISDVHFKERTVKPRIKEIIEDEAIKQHISDDELNAINIYLRTTWSYYLKPNYDNNAISVFNSAIRAYAHIVSEKVLRAKDDLLNFQATLIKTHR